MGFVVFTKPHGVVRSVEETDIGIRRFHIPESRYDAPPGKPYSYLYGDPTILRLPDGRWVGRDKDDPPLCWYEAAPRQVQETFEKEGEFIEWIRGPLSEYDVPLIRTITEPLPEFATDQAAFEARMSGYPPQAALAPSGSKPPATVEAPSQDAGTKKESSGSKAAKRRENLIALIEAYSESGLWGVETRQLATTAKIKLSTMYRYLEHEDVKPTWKQYQRNSIGKRPISIDDR